MFKTLSGPVIAGLCALFASTFIAVTTEVAPVGLLIDMAKSFNITEGHAGLAVSAYALLVAFGAVPITIATSRMDRKMLMLLCLAGYVTSNLISAMAPNFAIVCAGRALGGLSHALMMSIAAAYAAHLVPERMTGRAISFVFGGTSLGSVLGVPGAAAISHFASWRVALYVIAGLAALLTIFIALYLPPVRGADTKALKVPTIRSPQAARIFGVVIGVNAVFFFAHNLLYTYVSPLLLAHGLPEHLLSVALLITGGVSIFGLWGAGQVVDRWPAAGLFGGGLAMLTGMILVYGHLISAWPSVGAVGLWCMGYAAIIPFVMSGAIRARATSADVAGAAINSSSNFGILLGSAIGGHLLSTLGFAVLCPASVVIALGGILLAAFNPAAFPRRLQQD
ncbi:MFS transporter [Gluconobacter oxydans]|uniref:Sugar efflux protein n=3 Tax=Gluconobacter oxydans TaxID=442 RepID=A0A829WW51_GLUOY|nr:MFS transporter [Gluconobacter oxydans]AAW60462.1 Putative sugar efflux protein [Gluconobacter oxydans 621H]KXV33164.1 sugar transporter [Gluconobacter oxydans]KXV64154.1 sugar transporter [Gluconobacter oxydans]MBF0857149.1 MFS transporter [Gluconobacter oxydans]TCW23053.1 putative MFS family arabinose efflux permease [Gluconobacter oxydans]